MKEKLTQCQYGDIAHLEEYDPLYCLCDELEAETNPYDRTLKHSIAVVKVTTPTPTNTETMVGIRGAWQPGFTYYAKNNGSNTTYIAVPKSTYISYSDKGTDGGGFRDFYVAMYDETNHKCTSYKKSRAHGAGGKIEESKIASVTVSNADEILTYDWDGFKGNYEYVNMGNNIGMATMNIGANSPEDYGYYFRFGEQEGWKIEGYYTDANNHKAIFVNDTTFKVPLNATNCRQYRNDGIVRTYFSNMEFYSNSYYGIWGLNSCSIPDTNGDGSYFQGLINKSVNNTTYGDASTYNWGAGWMTMSSDIITSNNWTTIEETTSPRAGYWLSSNNKTVFWPAACHCLAHQRQGEDPLKSHKYCGHYWSVLPKGTEKAYYYNFVIGRVKIEWTDGTSSSSSTTSDTDGGGRHGGFSIRPICDLSK